MVRRLAAAGLPIASIFTKDDLTEMLKPKERVDAKEDAQGVFFF